MQNYLVGIVSIAGIVLFAGIVLSLDIVQAGSNPAIKTISDLVHGSFGWLQNLAFLLVALALVIFMIRLYLFTKRKISSRIGITLFGITGISFLLLPIFPSQPPGINLPLQVIMHNSVAGLISASFMLGCIAFTFYFNKEPNWKRYWIYTLTTVFICLIFALLWALLPRGLHLEGLGEQFLFISGLTWVIVISIKLMKIYRHVRKSEINLT